MITPSLFLNLLTASVCPQMDLRLQAQRGPLLGSLLTTGVAFTVSLSFWGLE